MKQILVGMLFVLVVNTSSQAVETEEVLSFSFQDETLNGVFNLPDTTEVEGVVLIIHGYGETNAVAQNWYADVRSVMLRAGYATFMWDKIGCGNSTGTFDINQPVQSSADEAIAAINMLQKLSKPGSENIALWGISRAGWINPLIIQKYAGIRFWISWSGVDGMENFHYLLKQNNKIDGLSQQQASVIAKEWLQGVHIAHSGAPYSVYKEATQNLAANPFWLRFTNGGVSWLNYPTYKHDMQDMTLDRNTGLPIYINNFENLLKDIKVPVLAMFGEKDMNVDWRKTRELYNETLTTPAQLTTYSFPNCNHNLFLASTGGYYEFEDDGLPWERCSGVLDSMYRWLTSSESR
jgi:hypothetical protein